MKVVLIKDVPKIGRKGEVKNVSDGFALNSLIPKGLAVSGTPNAIRKAELETKAQEEKRAADEKLILENLKKIESKQVEISGKANEKGHLFASIHEEEIAMELSKLTGVEISAGIVRLPKAIKEVGDYEVGVKVGNKVAKVQIVIKAD